MTLTELPEEVVSIGREARASRRKRPRCDHSRLNKTQVVRLDDAIRPHAEDVPIPPIRVDKDLLVQVVRIKVQTLIRKAKLREQGLLTDGKHDPQCTAERLERLVPVIEQRWLQDLLSGDEPRCGFDDVVQVLQEILHSDDGQENR